MSLPVILEAAGLRISFHTCEDRIAHTVGLLIDGRIVPLLASLEGTADDDWPPSPPLTNVEVVQQGHRQQAMLLGMAGRSHWSATVIANESARRMEFEMACRLKEPPQHLGSSYRSMVAGKTWNSGIELEWSAQRPGPRRNDGRWFDSAG
jgi:hypothetical protein